MTKVIKISDKVVEELDKLRHVGQSYDGVLQELLRKCEGVTTESLDDSQ